MGVLFSWRVSADISLMSCPDGLVHCIHLQLSYKPDSRSNVMKLGLLSSLPVVIFATALTLVVSTFLSRAAEADALEYSEKEVCFLKLFLCFCWLFLTVCRCWFRSGGGGSIRTIDGICM
jgi:hypothetical protein